VLNALRSPSASWQWSSSRDHPPGRRWNSRALPARFLAIDRAGGALAGGWSPAERARCRLVL